MKLTAAILAALMLFMSAQKPMLTLRSAAPSAPPVMETCKPVLSGCSKNQKPASCSEKPKKCCDTNFCNPFGACCPFTPAERTQLHFAGFVIKQVKLPLADENILPGYSGDIWQPPELCPQS